MPSSTLPAGVQLPEGRHAETSCPACGEGGARVVYAVERIPVHSNVLLAGRAEALAYPRGDLELAHCARCGLLWNPRYDAARGEYGTGYEETQGFSATFRRWMGELTSRIADRYALAGGRVIEIGCGKGEFLIELVGRTGAHGVGYDPTLDAARVHAPDGVELLARRYGPEDRGVAADLVCCRHTLEHVPDVRAFVRTLRENVASGTPVFFEVPDVLRELEEGAFWDVYYEHCSYFTCGSIARLFRAAGFDVEHLELGYAGQYVLLFARAAEGPTRARLAAEDDLARTAAAVERFRDSVRASLARWHDFLTRARERGEAVVPWGSGSKGVGFLTTLGGESGIRHVVDVNPHKHGRFMAGTGQEIVPPEFLRAHPPAHVLVMNPIYRDEIGAELARLGVRAELHVL